ncbi:hypothetical protein FZEAL_4632 [Fusarium zealandicum]|uniref:Uncharacterized protein n=1 Tax=Fusarium zealandicum TaxID=1053134 RepID=A0A8H4XKM0_9HYPO|nr:hypothetical protein FZEAL_4632 [Fusarium zealandicum]
MHLAKVLPLATLLLSSTASPQEQDSIKHLEARGDFHEPCSPLWTAARSVRQAFVDRRPQVDPSQLTSFDNFFQYYESGMYNMLEACGTLQRF